MKQFRYFLIAAAVALLIGVCARSVASWRNYGDLNHNAPGVWLGMAVDARDGVLYRPLVSDLGYGGTRYGPLFPIIIAAFMKVGMEPVNAGFVAGILAAAVAIAGLYAIMRALRVERAIAASMAVFLIAATTTHSIILGIRCDLLPLGLSLLGMAAVVWASEAENDSGLRWMSMAGACFALALACKVTSMLGAGTALIWLVLNKRMRLAVAHCVASAVMFVILAAAVELQSHGRAGAILSSSASGGGGLSRFVRGPIVMGQDIIQRDHALAIFLTLAIVLIAAGNLWRSLPAIFLFLSGIGTMALYGSPGVHSNHLVDVTAASLLVLAAPMVRARQLQKSFMVVSALLVVVAAGFCVRQVEQIKRERIKYQFAAALKDADQSSTQGPILSEAPLLPIIAGERPYMLDPFIFRAVRARHPEIAQKLWKDLDGRNFKAVILHGPPDDPRFASNEDDFGPGFIERLQSDYSLAGADGDFYVFLPRK